MLSSNYATRSKRLGGGQLEESDLARFSKFLWFPIEGLEKDILDFFG